MSKLSNFQHRREMDSLIKKVGSVEACERLGFIYQHDEMRHLSEAGFEYLLYLAEIDSDGTLAVATAFAKEYQRKAAENEDS